MMRSLAVLLSLAALSMGQFVSPPVLLLGSPSNTTICGSVSISWDWTGSNKGTTFLVTNDVPENAISTSQPVPPQPYTATIGETIDLMDKSFIWQQAAVPGGWYAFKVFDQAVGGTVSQQSTSFFVFGGAIPTCTLVVETGTVGRGPTSDGSPTATPVPTQAPGGSIPDDGNSPSQSGGGINAGVIAGIVLGALAGVAIAAVLFFFLCRRRGRGFIRASRAFGKLDAEAKGNAAKSSHGRWGGLGSVDVTTAANQAKAAAAGAVGGAAAQKDFPFSSSTANGGSTAAQSRITLGDEKTENDDENPFKEPTVPSLHSHPSETLINEVSRVASPVSRTTSPRPAPPPPPARRGSVLSSSSSSQDHGSAPNSPPLTAQRVGPRGPPPPITPRANRTNTGPKTPTLSPRARTGSLKEFVDQNQGYAMAAYSVNGSGQDEQARYSRLSNMPALAHAVPTAIITTPRPPSTIGLPLTQPRRKPAPVYDVEMKGKYEAESSASTSTSGLGLSMGESTSGGNVSSTTLGNATGSGALGSGTGIGLAADGDGPVHYLIPDLPPPQPRGR